MSTVLVVEDELVLLDAVREALEEEGYHTVGAHNGEVALRLIAEARPDLVLLDLMMPIIDGQRVLERLPTATGGRPPKVILMTSADRPRLAVDGYLRKPFTVDRLLGAIRTALSDDASGKD